MPTFEYEMPLDVSASDMWEAMKNQDDILPKAMPQEIASIHWVEGTGAVGSVRVVKFGPVAPEGAHVKERVVRRDSEGYTVVTEELEGGHLEEFGLKKWVRTLRLIPTGDNSSLLRVTIEYEGGTDANIAKAEERTKEGVNNAFRALERHVKSLLKPILK